MTPTIIVPENATLRAAPADTAPPAPTVTTAIPFEPVTRLDVPDDFKGKELAWKLSVTEDNPILWIPNSADVAAGALPPTGFEPYFLGTDLSPKQTLLAIAELGAQELELLAGRHHDDEYYIGRVLSILQSGQISEHDPQRAQDIQTLAELDAILGSLTRRLGRQAEADPEARAYREDTHRLVNPFIPRLTYARPGAERVIETYQLPDVSRTKGTMAPELSDLPTYRLRQGWRFLALLGTRLGNGPVRTGLQGRWVQLPLPYRY